jgi:hypothetical protein
MSGQSKAADPYPHPITIVLADNSRAGRSFSRRFSAAIFSAWRQRSFAARAVHVDVALTTGGVSLDFIGTLDLGHCTHFAVMSPSVRNRQDWWGGENAVILRGQVISWMRSG